MREVFVDSSAWIALADESDEWHGVARKLYPQLLASSRLITTNLVLAETYTLIRYELGWTAAMTFLERVKSSPRIEVERAGSELEAAAEEILKRYRDHPFSYTDAVSFAVMKARSITEAFTFDRHFATAGFNPPGPSEDGPPVVSAPR